MRGYVNDRTPLFRLIRPHFQRQAKAGGLGEQFPISFVMLHLGLIEESKISFQAKK